MALCFKHLLQVYPDVLATDERLLALWKLFHYRPLATNFVKNAAEMYGKKQVRPSVTRWTTHDQACKNLCDGFKQIVSALATCTNKSKEADALGIFVEITLLKFLATSLMLYDTFVGVQPLSLVLQKSGESLVLADIPVYLDKTMSFLEKLKSANKRPFFTKPKFQQIN